MTALPRCRHRGPAAGEWFPCNNPNLYTPNGVKAAGCVACAETPYCDQSLKQRLSINELAGIRH